MTPLPQPRRELEQAIWTGQNKQGPFLVAAPGWASAASKSCWLLCIKPSPTPTLQSTLPPNLDELPGSLPPGFYMPANLVDDRGRVVFLVL